MSLALDSEITELEQSSLRAHLRACASCARFARAAEATALAVRAAPPVAPARPLLTAARRHGARSSFRLAASAAAVAAALALGGLAGTLSSQSGGASPQAEAASHRLLIQQSLLALMAGSAGRHDDGGRVVPS